MKSSPKWRTVLAVLGLALVLLEALVLCLAAGDLGAKIFPDFAHAIILLAITLTAGHSVQHLADGTGLKGAAAVLMTDAKPGATQPEDPPK